MASLLSQPHPYVLEIFFASTKILKILNTKAVSFFVTGILVLFKLWHERLYKAKFFN